MQVTFGAGTVMGKRIDTPNLPIIFFGVTQEWTMDIDQKLVTLIGQNKDPVDVAPSERTVTGKIKFARVQASGMGNLLFGNSPTAGAGFEIVGPENHSAIASTTLTVTNGATFLQDLGLFYHNTAVALVPVTAAPTAGQYIAGVVGVGAYTIAVADEAVVGGIDAYYQQSLATEQQIDVVPALMGTGPTIELNMSTPYNVAGINKKLSIQMYAARIGKMALSFGNTKYLVPEMDYTLFGSGSHGGNLLRWSSSE